MKKIFLLYIFLLTGLPSCRSIYMISGIREIDSFSQATEILDNADSKTLVLFDVDDTLIMPASRIFRPKLQLENKDWVNAMMAQAFQKAKKPDNFYIDIWMMKELPFVIEPSIIETIKVLQDRGVMVLALTRLDTGSSALIQSIPEWRLSTLKKIGIDFNRISVPKDMVFDELTKDTEGNFPILYQGMLCCGAASKGDVLNAFLDHVSWKPDKVIFFDNDMKYLESVAQELRKRNIPFYGYHYRGAEHVIDKLDKDIAELQINHLIDNEEWLTEDEARALLAKEIKSTAGTVVLLNGTYFPLIRI